MYTCPQPSVCHVRRHFDKANCKASALTPHGAPRDARSVAVPPTTATRQKRESVAGYDIESRADFLASVGISADDKPLSKDEGTRAAVYVYPEGVIRLTPFDDPQEYPDASEARHMLDQWRVSQKIAQQGAPIIEAEKVGIVRDDKGDYYAAVAMPSVFPLNRIEDDAETLSDVIAELHSFDLSKLSESDRATLESRRKQRIENEYDAEMTSKAIDSYGKSGIHSSDLVLSHGDCHARNFATTQDGRHILIDLDNLSMSRRTVDLTTLADEYQQELDSFEGYDVDDSEYGEELFGNTINIVDAYMKAAERWNGSSH